MITVSMITEVEAYSKYLPFQNPGGMGTIVPVWARELEKLGCRVLLNDAEADWDLLHLHSPLPNSLYLAIRAKLSQKPVLTHGHHLPELVKGGFKGGSLIYPMFNLYSRYFYNLGEIVIAPSPYAAKVLRKLGVRRPIEVISNGIDRERFRRDLASRKLFRERLGMDESSPMVVSVGLRIPRKGVDTFMETAVEFGRRNPGSDTKFVWVGGSEPLLQDAMPEGGLPENVLFAGHVPFEDMPMAYSAADMFLFPTRAESFGNVVVEAASCGLPLIVRDIPVFDDWLVSGSDCVKCCTTDDFVRAVELLSGDEGERRQLVEASESLADRHDVRNTARRLFEIYSELVSG